MPPLVHTDASVAAFFPLAFCTTRRFGGNDALAVTVPLADTIPIYHATADGQFRAVAVSPTSSPLTTAPLDDFTAAHGYGPAFRRGSEVSPAVLFLVGQHPPRE